MRGIYSNSYGAGYIIGTITGDYITGYGMIVYGQSLQDRFQFSDGYGYYAIVSDVRLTQLYSAIVF